jgi:hypothetical protein
MENEFFVGDSSVPGPDLGAVTGIEPEEIFRRRKLEDLGIEGGQGRFGAGAVGRSVESKCFSQAARIPVSIRVYGTIGRSGGVQQRALVRVAGV